MSWAGTNCTSHVNVNSPVVPLHFLPECQGPLSMFSVPYILTCNSHWPHNSGKIKYNRYTLQVHPYFDTSNMSVAQTNQKLASYSSAKYL